MASLAEVALTTIGAGITAIVVARIKSDASVKVAQIEADVQRHMLAQRTEDKKMEEAEDGGRGKKPIQLPLQPWWLYVAMFAPPVLLLVLQSNSKTPLTRADVFVIAGALALIVGDAILLLLLMVVESIGNVLVRALKAAGGME